ncbi:MAG TPA: YdcH family protein [Pyrinomonadaceae bacterium]|nr:YdcH family protein [Pyrinomonadaceae bacterium]
MASQKSPPARSSKSRDASERSFPAMETTSTDSLKELLMTSDPEFRELAREHTRYEARLSELSSLQYPSDEEQLEEITLKKKKLAVKDQMQAIILRHQKSHETAH